MQQLFDLNRQTEKLLHVSENCMDVLPIVQLLNLQCVWLLGKSYRVRSGRAANPCLKARGDAAPISSTISRLANGDAPDIETFATLIAWLELDANQFFRVPYEQKVQHDGWTHLYLCLLDLEIPHELIEAVVTILRLVTSKQRGEL